VTVGVWPGWNGTSVVCSDCGRPAAPIDRTVAVAIIGDLTYRFATLSDPDARSGDGSQYSLAVRECAARVSEILTTLDVHLRRLSALDGGTRGLAAETDRLPTVRGTGEHVHASGGGLFEGAARLAWTIRGMTEACWYRPSTVDGASAAEMTWVALHRALHYFEDAQLVGNSSAAVDGRTSRNPNDIPNGSRTSVHTG
jgi:hypothetical protein